MLHGVMSMGYLPAVFTMQLPVSAKEPDGIVMIYKRLTAQGSYRWPRNKSEVRNLTWREFDWLMSGIDIEQPKAIKAT